MCHLFDRIPGDDNCASVMFLRFILLSFLSVIAVAELDDPVFFSGIKGSMNGNYIAFQAVIANNKVRTFLLIGKF